tara:strand:- start:232 stop:573 length:342 start_codon:yes stop_codon:yes gene_type:complete
MEIHNPGRVCIKTAGKDAGKIAIIVEKIDDTYVLIDGNVKRKKCNVKHLHPTEKVLDIKKSASTAEVHKAMTSQKLEVIPRKEKPKKEEPVKEKPKKEKKLKKKKDAKPRKTA